MSTLRKGNKMTVSFEYETKCKRCDFINAHTKENIEIYNKETAIDYLLIDSARVISPNVYVNMFNCEGCNKFTVQEFVSIKEIK